MLRRFNEESTVSSTNGIDTTGYQHTKEQIRKSGSPTSYHKQKLTQIESKA